MTMETNTYQNLLMQAQKLNPLEQLRLLETLAGAMRRQSALQTRHSILELQGLGKEIWRDVDAQSYVNEERNSWVG